MSSQRRFPIVFTVLACVLAGQLLAQRSNFLLFTDPGRRFSIEFPNEWSWMIIAGSGEALVTFVHPRKEAAIVVERFRMRQPLARDEITDLFAQIETDVLKENQPQVSDAASKVVTESGKRLILIDYFRPGLDVREQVRQYSLPVGQDLYRITCMAVMSQFARYETIFANVASSLKSAGELPPAPASKR